MEPAVHIAGAVMSPWLSSTTKRVEQTALLRGKPASRPLAVGSDRYGCASSSTNASER